MRGTLAGSYATEKSPSKKAKRRYDVALNTPGVEIRLPSLPRIALGWRLLSGILVLLLGAAVYFTWSSPLFQVNNLEVEGLERLTIEDLNAVANVVGRSILFVEPARIREDILKAFPEISELSVDINLPASVIVKAVERRPVITWKQGDKVFWVDSNGVVFPRRGDDGPSVVIKAENLPISTTTTTNQPVDEGKKDELDETLQLEPISEPAIVVIPQDLIQAILELSDEKPKKTPLIYNEEHGLGWKDAKGWQVFFGADVDQIEMKLDVYEAIVKRLKKEGVNPSLISVENVHAPYYRMER
jgi:cell division septal protein FtsQ